MVLVYGYSKCSTVKKSLKFLQDNNIEFEHIDNVQNKLSKEQLQNLYEISNLDKKKFFNTSGIRYKELKLKDKVNNFSDDEAFSLLATDGMLVKRPILKANNNVLVGFKIKEWEELLLANKE